MHTDAGQRRVALLLDHLEIALQPILHIRRREVARIDRIGLDEGRRLAVARFSTSRRIKQLAGRCLRWAHRPPCVRCRTAESAVCRCPPGGCRGCRPRRRRRRRCAGRPGRNTRPPRRAACWPRCRPPGWRGCWPSTRPSPPAPPATGWPWAGRAWCR